MRWTREDGFAIDDDHTAVDRPLLQEWLTSADAYWWAEGLNPAVLDRAVDHSLPFSVLSPGGDFVGFARVVTDFATFGYVADVFIAREHRSAGLGHWLATVIAAHPRLASCRRLMLATADAHAMYAEAGFTPLANPSRWMERHNPRGPA